MEEKVLTIMLDQEIQPEQRDRIQSLAFVAVQPYKDGYKEIVILSMIGQIPKYSYLSLQDAEKAVKRIASKSS